MHASSVAEPEVSTAWLVVDGECVYELARNSVLNIGRLESNDIVLNDKRISREHAVLKFTGQGFVIVDLASTLGTYVNGRRIDRCPVQFGDAIMVGCHEIALSRARPEGLKHESRYRTAPKMARTLDRRLKFFGGLNEFALITLVQFLSQERQSGLLFLESEGKSGPRIYLVEGEIIHVENEENLGEQLVRQNHPESLLFYFRHESHFPERTIFKSTPCYLMQLCHAHDEEKGRERDRVDLVPSFEAKTVTSRIEMPPLKR